MCANVLTERQIQTEEISKIVLPVLKFSCQKFKNYPPSNFVLENSVSAAQYLKCLVLMYIYLMRTQSDQR